MRNDPIEVTKILFVRQNSKIMVQKYKLNNKSEDGSIKICERFKSIFIFAFLLRCCHATTTCHQTSSDRYQRNLLFKLDGLYYLVQAQMVLFNCQE